MLHDRRQGRFRGSRAIAAVGGPRPRGRLRGPRQGAQQPVLLRRDADGPANSRHASRRVMHDDIVHCMHTQAGQCDRPQAKAQQRDGSVTTNRPLHPFEARLLPDWSVLGWGVRVPGTSATSVSFGRLICLRRPPSRAGACPSRLLSFVAARCAATACESRRIQSSTAST